MRIDQLLRTHRDLQDTREMYEEARQDWHQALLDYFDTPRAKRPVSVVNLAYALGMQPAALYQTRVRLRRKQARQ